MTRELSAAEKMATALFEAINREACAGSTADEPLFDPQTAIDGLTLTIAAIIESHPLIETPRDVRKAVEAVAEDLKRQIKRFRQVFDETGEHAFAARRVDLN
jgi:hypothetical protein